MISPLTAIEQNIHPFTIYKEMRENNPVYYDPQRGNWNVFLYEDVLKVLSDYTNFSSQFHGGGAADPAEEANGPFAASLISTDPPRHRQLRSLVTQAFTPRAVENLAPRISEIVNQQLDQVMAAGRMDVIQDIGYPLPTIVIAELLGIPTEDREQFKRWSDFAVQSANFGDSLDYERFMGTEMMEMGLYFLKMIAQRQEKPGNDLITGLLTASIDGERLTQIELLGFCVLLLVAGNETTTNLIGNSILSFTERPGEWEKMRANPGLIPSAIEEVLRFRSPVQAMFRSSTQEVKMNGAVVPAHVPVMAWIGSANHDETQFTHPEILDIERAPNKHLAFGNGIHYCLGAPLARLEAKIALSGMIERFSSISVASGAQLKRQPSLIVYGLHNLPITFAT